MEKRLCEVKIGNRKLIANLAKHPRKPQGVLPAPNHSERRPQAPPAKQGFPQAFRDGRSFLEASMGLEQGNTHQSYTASPAIRLAHSNANKACLDDKVLIGEVKDFNTLENIQSLLGLDGYGSILCKYLGGLQVLIRFGSTSNAKKFHDNLEQWKCLFSWLDYIQNKEFRYERIAWLKITGVPLLAWDEKNFEVVAKKYGKVCAHSNRLEICSDLSYGKIPVITCMRKKINEEFSGEMNGKTFRLGVCEIEEDWYPFKPFTTFCHVESDDDDEEEEEEEFDSDGEDENIPATPKKADERLEDGEIAPENMPDEEMAVGVETTHAGRIVPNPLNNCMGNPNDTLNANTSADAHVLEPTCHSETVDSPQPLNFPVLDPAAGPGFGTSNIGLPLTESVGPVEENQSRVKRRKIIRGQSRFNPYKTPTHVINSPLPPNHGEQTIPQDNLARDTDSNKSIDLNRNVSHVSESSSSTNEVDATTALGKSIGFQIEVDSVALVHAVNSDGVDTVFQ
ncbi:hypothetical protein L2E82_28905 [Cichorium intybus]|uniref:Uncharacterized protein n=1 Tax=Cichorium intybus TaxID=13427 RepID=A0ACB9CWU5_CICIN|nr:hypothetical protein L2E82_28905 [Cichorium intybus]